MSEHIITEDFIRSFEENLRVEERSDATVDKYIHELRKFRQWLCGKPVTKEQVTVYKEQLRISGKATATVNGVLAALHAFFAYLDWRDCRVKYLKLQQRLFRDSSRELTKAEYERLVSTALAQNKQRLALVLETICATGIRVSELRYITVEALKIGRTDISLKGKVRTILLPGKLCRKLMKYTKKNKIGSGEIFLTSRGKSLSRTRIWTEMKALCSKAGVDASKVFPHNLRHLFARSFYKACRDIARLADILGHSSIETTRIYLISSSKEHEAQLEKLGLVS